MLCHRTQKKLIFITIVLCIAVALCSIDHSGPMTGTTEHAHAASVGCISNLCVTLTSNDTSLFVRPVGLFLFLSSILFFALNPPPFKIGSSLGHRFFGANHYPWAFKKLYQLHAAYLL